MSEDDTSEEGTGLDLSRRTVLKLMGGTSAITGGAVPVTADPARDVSCKKELRKNTEYTVRNCKSSHSPNEMPQSEDFDKLITFKGKGRTSKPSRFPCAYKYVVADREDRNGRVKKGKKADSQDCAAIQERWPYDPLPGDDKTAVAAGDVSKDDVDTFKVKGPFARFLAFTEMDVEIDPINGNLDPSKRWSVSIKCESGDWHYKVWFARDKKPKLERSAEEDDDSTGVDEIGGYIEGNLYDRRPNRDSDRLPNRDGYRVYGELKKIKLRSLDDVDGDIRILAGGIGDYNQPPTVSLSKDTSSPIDTDDTVTFTAHASDPDGPDEKLSYNWDIKGPIPGINFGSTNGNTATISDGIEGEYTVEVTVTDVEDGKSSETDTITVKEIEDPPSVTLSSEPSAPVAGETIRFTAEWEDPDSDDIIREVSWEGPDGLSGNGRKATWPNAKAGTHTVKVTVWSSERGSASVEDSASAEVTVDVTDTTETPTVTASVDYPGVEPFVGEEITFTADANDSDGTITSYEWSGDVSGSGSSVTTTFARSSTKTATVTVEDDDGASASDSVSVSIEDPDPTPT